MLHRLALVHITLLFLAIGSVQGQQAAKSYDVHGTVVNSQTGAPIPRVLVTILDPDIRMALTDGVGQFQFAGVSTAPAEIYVGKPGFLQPGKLSTNSDSSEPVEVDSQSGSIVIKLAPSSAISGRIASPDGSPLESVPVHLFYRGPVNGEDRLVPKGSINSDEDGQFNFNDLPSGQYFIQAGPMFHQPPIPVVHSGIPLESYGLLFYPGVSDPHAASPIDLGIGQDATVAFTLPSARSFKVQGQLIGVRPADNATLLFMPAFGDSGDIRAQVDQATFRFVVAPVPAGQYRLSIVTPNGVEGEREISVNSDVMDVKLSLSQPRRIPLVVHTADRRAEGAYVSVTLKPEDRWQSPVSAERIPGNSSQQLSILEPQPGKYWFQFHLSPYVYVRAAVCGAADLLHEPLVLTGQNVDPIELTIGYGLASLGGQVRLRDQSGQKYILVVPVDPPGEARIVLTTMAGTFGYLQLPPGTYRVWAFNHLPPYFNEVEKMEQYASSAQVVTLALDQKLELTLDIVEAADDDE